MKKYFILLLTLLLFSCGENKNMKSENLDSTRIDTVNVDSTFRDSSNVVKHELNESLSYSKLIGNYHLTLNGQKGDWNLTVNHDGLIIIRNAEKEEVDNMLILAFNEKSSELEVKDKKGGELSFHNLYAQHENGKWRIDFISMNSPNNYSFIQE